MKKTIKTIKNHLFWLILIVSSTAAAALCEPCAGAETLQMLDRPRKSEDNAGFALVEVFTSENCKRCLGVEELIEQTTSGKISEGKKIYPLFFSVDYMNTQQWRDDLGRLLFTERQRSYGQLFSLPKVEAGQVVVNGQWQVPGGDYQKVSRAIDRALASPAKMTV